MTRHMRSEDVRVLPVGREEYAGLCRRVSGGFLQSPEWGDFKGRHGWTPGYVGFYKKGEAVGGGMFLRRDLPGGKSFLYYPKGPRINTADTDFFADVMDELPRATYAAAGARPLFLRVETDIREEESAALLRRMRRAGYVKAPYDVQYRDTRLLTITDEKALWEGFTSKQRNKIRTAPKKDVEISALKSAEEIAEWYGLYRETAARNNIFIHPREYYEDFFRTFSGEGWLTVFGARYRGELIAGSFILHYNGESVYMFSASGQTERNRRPNEAIQWEALKEAAERGSASYDMWGVAPEGAKNHPWAGLSEFKAGFGGEHVRYAGCYDYPFSMAGYVFFVFAEKARKMLLSFKKRLRSLF